jgi:hypothetical protein
MDDRTNALLVNVAERLVDINARLDRLQVADAANARKRHDAQVRSDALVMAEATRADAARRAAEQDEADRQERYRQRRNLDHENGKFTATATLFNQALDGFGRTVPAPQTDMSYTRYLRRCVDAAQPYLRADHDCAKLDFLDPDRVPRDVLTKLADRVLAGVKAAVWDGSTVAKGQMREVVVKDPMTNQIQNISYVGRSDEVFVKKMGRPCRRVVNFNRNDGTPYAW